MTHAHILAAPPAAPSGPPTLTIAMHTGFWADDPSWSNPGNGNAVSSWRDYSGNTRHAVQATGSKQPIFRSSVASLNNRAGVDFDGTDDWLTVTYSNLSQPSTRVLVARQDVVVQDKHIFSTPSGSTRNDVVASQGAGKTWSFYAGNTEVGATAADTSVHIVIVTFNGTSSQGQIDGTTWGSGLTNPNVSGGIQLGSTLDSTGSCCNCHIAFAALYSGALTSGDKSSIRAWAQSYYGTP